MAQFSWTVDSGRVEQAERGARQGNRGEFLIDTGAYGAMMDLEIAEALQLTLHDTRDVHGIHGFGRLQQYLGRVFLPAFDAEGRRTVYAAVTECVGVPSLRDKNREHGVEVIGILGRMFLGNSRLAIDGATGRKELEIYELSSNDPR